MESGSDPIDTLTMGVDSLRIDPAANKSTASLRQMKERLAFNKDESHVTEMIKAIPKGNTTSFEQTFHICYYKCFMKSMYLTSCLQTAWLCVSSPDSPFSLSLVNFHTVHPPMLLLSSASILINLFPTYSLSLLTTWPYDFNLASCTFLDISPIFIVILILSFLILSIFATPHIYFNILISASSNSSVLSPLFLYGIACTCLRYSLSDRRLDSLSSVTDWSSQWSDGCHPICLRSTTANRPLARFRHDSREYCGCS